MVLPNFLQGHGRFLTIHHNASWDWTIF